MTHDLIQDALTARADVHDDPVDSDTRDVISLSRASSGRNRRSGSPRWHRALVGVAAVVVVFLAVGGTYALRDEGTGSVEASDSPATNGATDRLTAPRAEHAAREHLERFFVALDDGDFVTAAELLGGAEVAPQVVAYLDPTEGEDLASALGRYCTTAFCGGQVIAEAAPSIEDDIQLFLVTTRIPAGGLGEGEPAAQHSMEFAVSWSDGRWTPLDLPPRP